MDEQSAWSCFAKTGSVQDYLRYAQCRADTGKEEEQPDAGRDTGNRHPGVRCGGT
ncbi:MAG: hypothetical protein LKE53_09970 [Oscillospiraceae bacterium]|nr:hypothetical protein [Oscillospiraceae bacterium]MDD3261032.1 hypothetical protein [Oscillospiraceae bacterium]